ncbi:hypothetical protein HFP15_30315 [Amycolatopsis sp. K13G38]|uniref:Uncharacterized protein n=1 Tax=Amycolatopsis acididurans TaxID=2724524 RepID=A0ABX1JE83_9PSEU|nr:DUF6480 family protein [Amycolatopsis acididurans]NKQ57174.1 hypothetical protein [Amycolatopsis acididurans]
MTTPPPDPDPDRTPGLEPGGGVRPGDTPPDSGQTSGLSHQEPKPPKVLPWATITVSAVLALLVAALIVASAVGWPPF